MKTIDMNMGTIYRANETYSNSAFYLLSGPSAVMAMLSDGKDPVATTEGARGTRLAVIASNVADLRKHEDALSKLSSRDFIGESMSSKLLPDGLFLTSIAPGNIAMTYEEFEDQQAMLRVRREHAQNQKDLRRTVAAARHAEFTQRLAVAGIEDANLFVHPDTGTVSISVETLRSLLPEV